MALQHLRASTANKRPAPGSMADGQLAMNTAASSPGLFYKDSGGALVKVGPVHVGTTAPNASPAVGGTAGNSVGEQWLDTTGGTYVFKVWDGTAWRSESGTFVDASGDVMTGALGIIAGTAAAPGLYVSGDTNTGIYSPGADQLALATGGTGRLFVGSTGRVGLGTASSISPSSPLEDFHIASTDPAVLLEETDAGADEKFWRIRADGSILRFEGVNDAFNSTQSWLNVTRSAGARTVDNIALNTGTTERLRVTSDGYVRLSASSPGIQFNGDTALANALDDYEEGTFTPSIVGTSTAGTATYGTNGQQGRYTKIGNRVFFDLYLAWSAHTGTGDLQINGMPFTVQNTTNLNRTYSTIFSSLTLTAGSIGAAFSSPNTTTIALRQLPTGGGAVATIPMDTSAQISISGSFDV